ncbi:MAG: plastocyanin/azurin family copper-binding protein, partial [Gaiellaceae bacterium]
VAVAGARTNVPGSTVVTVLAGKPSELKFKLSVNAVKRGTVVFKVTNKGLLPHDFKICSSPHGGLANSCAGKGTPVISPGKSATLKYTFKKAGTYEYLCTMPGHAAGGMKGDLKVT